MAEYLTQSEQMQARIAVALDRAERICAAARAVVEESPTSWGPAEAPLPYNPVQNGPLAAWVQDGAE